MRRNVLSECPREIRPSCLDFSQSGNCIRRRIQPLGTRTRMVPRFCVYAMTVIEDFLVWERGRRLVLRLTHCSLPLLSAYLEDYRMERRDDGGTDLIWE